MHAEDLPANRMRDDDLSIENEAGWTPYLPPGWTAQAQHREDVLINEIAQNERHLREWDESAGE